MRGNLKFFTPILIGAAAGAVVTLLMNTENGKQVLEEIKVAAIKALRGLKPSAKDSVEDAETAI